MYALKVTLFDCSLDGIKVAAFCRHKSIPGRSISQPLHDQLPAYCCAGVTARVCALLRTGQFFRELSVKTSASRSARNFRSSSLSTDDHRWRRESAGKKKNCSLCLKGAGRACHSRRVGRAAMLRTSMMHSMLCGENEIGKRIGEIDCECNRCQQSREICTYFTRLTLRLKQKLFRNTRRLYERILKKL